MPTKPSPRTVSVEGAVSPAEAWRFAAVAREVMTSPSKRIIPAIKHLISTLDVIRSALDFGGKRPFRME